MMLEILQYDFIQNALISGILISIAAGIIGSLVVVNNFWQVESLIAPMEELDLLFI